MTSVAALYRKVTRLEYQLTPQPEDNVFITCWCPDRGDGKSGFACFNTRTPDEKTPLSKAEVKALEEEGLL